LPEKGTFAETNGRDCDEELGKCREARAHVRANSIRDISLDVTPLLTRAKLVEDGGFDYERELKLELGRAPSRVFNDSAGNILAEGRLADFKNDRVFVTTVDGGTTEIPFGDLSDDDMCFVAAWWSIPTESGLGGGDVPQREWLASTLTWKSSGVCHKPLYFEEVQLERYGHTTGPLLQPFVSGAHFFGSVVALPYHAGINPPNECQYPVGYYRPGNCAPWLVPPAPVSIRGGLLTAGLYTGGAFFIP